ncbi:MAG: YgiQ family radical SAM protein [Ruminococcaceae bacterium]|nr:YgiQ family radical SAM protein [Oscillospiraceae bacterium]
MNEHKNENKQKAPKLNKTFLPVTAKEIKALGWDAPDFICVSADAYVDHPSFGISIISRVAESLGAKVAIIAQPDWKSTADFEKLGRPKYGFLVSAGNIDSMVAHYTVNKKKRSEDEYSPGGKAGQRPDRAAIVYCNRIRQAFGDIPIIIGGLEPSLRRFAHYDYWSDSVRSSILVDSGADILSYGMGERSVGEIVKRLMSGEPCSTITDVRGTCVLGKPDACAYDYVICPSAESIKKSKVDYAKACAIQYNEQDPVKGKAILQEHGNSFVIQNPPQTPLSREEMDAVYALPYTRTYHPMYEKDGGIPALEEVEFSITHNRGCFGDCNFCALTMHQGRMVTSRSEDSVVKEAELLTTLPNFKGYIHDVGGPTANFRYPACKKQTEHGFCKGKRCLAPTPCKNIEADQTEYARLLQRVAKIKGIKKVFVRSGIRFDYLMLDKNTMLFDTLVRNHVSGQLKVAPEHASDKVLRKMGKPPHSVYEAFCERFYMLTKKAGKKQYLVPYLMSSHPGSTLNDAIELALYLKKINYHPEQVQDFYPTPGTVSTCMFYTELDPFTLNPVYVPKTAEDKAMQRALLQYTKPQNRKLVMKALEKAGRRDLIGVLVK